MSSILFSRYRKSHILPAAQVAKVDQPSSLVGLGLFKVFRSSILCFSVGIGVACITLLGTSLSSVIAQVPPVSDTATSQANVMYVNPSSGNDQEGNGTESAPLKTITQALQKASANTVIMLSAGTYSTETGEAFPLILRPGISIQGDANNQGRGVIIQGGGEYLSKILGSQNISIIAGSQVNLSGVTITNPNRRGYGLWIESSNPVISQNTFTGNTQDGVFVTGNAAPTISQNNFESNGANGITIAGSSQAQVKENTFQQTGFGINIAQNAAPTIVNNQIQNNRAGIIIQANAHPILRNNIIEGNKEDGIVAIAQAMPDLGTDAEAGGNQFRNNARYDINASAAKQVIAAFGNTLTNSRVAGKVDLQAPRTLVARNVPTAEGGPEIAPTNGEITFSAPGAADTPNEVTVPTAPNSNSANNMRVGKLNPQLLPLLPANTSRLVPKPNPQPATTATTPSPVPGFPVPSSLAGTAATQRASVPPAPATSADTPQLNYVQINPSAIEFTAPQSPFDPQAQPATPRNTRAKKPPAPSNLLPVPNSNIPLGNTRNMRKVPVPQGSPAVNYNNQLPNTAAPMGNPLPNPVAPMNTPLPNAVPQMDNSPLPNTVAPTNNSPLPAGVSPMSNTPLPSNGIPMGTRYRVLVEVATQKDMEFVQSLVPTAFFTVSQGRNLMQAGVFSNRYNADTMIKTLNSNGLRAIIEVLN
ncbi:hypothetical protein NIES2107_42720 [Nostoc carneum NIES-2107]|nr:hypothetical protein NIES2107_42720 [Nostoc carneum NIES-2107]